MNAWLRRFSLLGWGGGREIRPVQLNKEPYHPPTLSETSLRIGEYWTKRCETRFYICGPNIEQIFEDLLNLLWKTWRHAVSKRTAPNEQSLWKVAGQFRQYRWSNLMITTPDRNEIWLSTHLKLTESIARLYLIECFGNAPSKNNDEGQHNGAVNP